MAKRLPYYKMYPADAETDENFRLLTDEELGFYWRCLNASWTNLGLPAEPAERARSLRTDQATADRLWIKVSRCFSEQGGRYLNKRQELERSKAVEKSEKSKEAAKVRWGSDADAMRTHSGCNADALPRAYESESVSESVCSSKEKKDAEIFPLVKSSDLRENAFQEIIGYFLAAGVLLTEGRIYSARSEWDSVPPEEFALAIALARDKARKNDARFMGWPANFIRAGDWSARGPGRILPEPLGKSDLAQELAERNFMRKRGLAT